MSDSKPLMKEYTKLLQGYTNKSVHIK